MGNACCGSADDADAGPTIEFPLDPFQPSNKSSDRVYDRGEVGPSSSPFLTNASVPAATKAYYVQPPRLSKPSGVLTSYDADSVMFYPSIPTSASAAPVAPNPGVNVNPIDSMMSDIHRVRALLNATPHAPVPPPTTPTHQVSSARALMSPICFSSPPSYRNMESGGARETPSILDSSGFSLARTLRQQQQFLAAATTTSPGSSRVGTPTPNIRTFRSTLRPSTPPASFRYTAVSPRITSNRRSMGVQANMGSLGSTANTAANAEPNTSRPLCSAAARMSPVDNNLLDSLAVDFRRCSQGTNPSLRAVGSAVYSDGPALHETTSMELNPEFLSYFPNTIIPVPHVTSLRAITSPPAGGHRHSARRLRPDGAESDSDDSSAIAPPPSSPTPTPGGQEPYGSPHLTPPVGEYHSNATSTVGSMHTPSSWVGSAAAQARRSMISQSMATQTVGYMPPSILKTRSIHRASMSPHTHRSQKQASLRLPVRVNPNNPSADMEDSFRRATNRWNHRLSTMGGSTFSRDSVVSMQWINLPLSKLAAGECSLIAHEVQWNPYQ